MNADPTTAAGLRERRYSTSGHANWVQLADDAIAHAESLETTLREARAYWQDKTAEQIADLTFALDDARSVLGAREHEQLFTAARRVVAERDTAVAQAAAYRAALEKVLCYHSARTSLPYEVIEPLRDTLAALARLGGR